MRLTARPRHSAKPIIYQNNYARHVTVEHTDRYRQHSRQVSPVYPFGKMPLHPNANANKHCNLNFGENLKWITILIFQPLSGLIYRCAVCILCKLYRIRFDAPLLHSVFTLYNNIGIHYYVKQTRVSVSGIQTFAWKVNVQRWTWKVKCTLYNYVVYNTNVQTHFSCRNCGPAYTVCTLCLVSNPAVALLVLKPLKTLSILNSLFIDSKLPVSEVLSYMMFSTHPLSCWLPSLLRLLYFIDDAVTYESSTIVMSLALSLSVIMSQVPVHVVVIVVLFPIPSSDLSIANSRSASVISA